MGLRRGRHPVHEAIESERPHNSDYFWLKCIPCTRNKPQRRQQRRDGWRRGVIWSGWRYGPKHDTVLRAGMRNILYRPSRASNHAIHKAKRPQPDVAEWRRCLCTTSTRRRFILAPSARDPDLSPDLPLRSRVPRTSPSSFPACRVRGPSTGALSRSAAPCLRC